MKNRTLLLHISLLAAILAASVPTPAHVGEGVGDIRQLYSFQIDQADAPDTSDGVIGGTEWDGAFSRELELSDGTTVALFLMNDSVNLYVGVAYEWADGANTNAVTLYFD